MRNEFALVIDGMHCDNCVRRVTQVLSGLPGLTLDWVKIGEAKLSSDENPAPIDVAMLALDKAGYSSHLVQ